MGIVEVLEGLPASGKSTYARKKSRNPKWKRVNKDDLRAMLDDSTHSGDNERFVLEIRDKIVLAALRKGQNVIVDDTNLHPKHERRIRSIVPAGTIVNRIVFDTSLEECLRRNALREGIARVPDDVVKRMFKDWEHWKLLDRTAYEVEPDFVEWIDGLPEVILCDIDGTIAHMTTRNPYEWNRVGEDTPDWTIIDILSTYTTWNEIGPDKIHIILMSGRDGVCRPETEEWLKVNCIPYDELHMRAEGDQRKDNIVKRELFDAHIRGRFNVRFVLDDRNQVVDMWREELGLKCLQVAPGDF